MVLEFMPCGSLHDLLHNTTALAAPALELATLSRIVVEVASGVAYLHYNGVMHRDIKTANVLLDESRHAKVTDFGISTRFGRMEYTAETGTYRHMAPEVTRRPPARTPPLARAHRRSRAQSQGGEGAEGTRERGGTRGQRGRGLGMRPLVGLTLWNALRPTSR